MDYSELKTLRHSFLLFRFGATEHIDQLYEEGTLHCNTIQYFAKIEDNDLRGDPDEHAFKYTQSTPGSILTITPIEGEYKGKSIPIRLNKGTLKQYADSAWGNIFCFYSIRLTDKPIGHEFTINSRCSKFGASCLFILDVNEFLVRLDSAMSLLNLNGIRDFVTYHDMSNFNGERNVFQKDKRFDYQQEFRLFFKHDLLEPIHFNIGSLKDIATVYSSDIVDHFRCKLG